MSALDISQYSGIRQNYIQNNMKIVNPDSVTVKPQAEQTATSGIGSVQSKDVSQGMNIREIGVTEDTTKKAPVTSIHPSDVSLTFQKENDFGYLGSNSSLDNLDVQKAISDMKKDSVLQQYQFFVGSSTDLTKFASEDGTVIQKM